MSVSPPPSTSSPYAESRRGTAPGDSSGAPPGRMPWVRLAVVAAILAASGGTRLWQERRLERTLRAGRISPFRLAELPMDLDSWKGHDAAMDPRIVRGSGSTDMITRRYVNQRTGVAIDVVVLYGPTSEMFIHTPEFCYPAAGFDPLTGTVERPIVVEGAGTVPFRSLAFTKGEGGLADTQEVYYSLWYDGRWTTQSTSPKASQRIPGMYKVQIARRISTRERRDLDNPCEPFLASLVGEIEARMARGRPHPSTTGH
jgi:Protein of unknown function (DUF3485)